MIELGRFCRQPQGYRAFIPHPFPPHQRFLFSPEIQKKAELSSHRIGKLEGTTKMLPDRNLFLLMYIRKAAASSSQIEGTRATMLDYIQAEVKIDNNLPKDVDDILHYVAALDYGIQRMEELPLSLRLLREMHQKLMIDARGGQSADPGQFRKSQNWIGGSTISNASFVPPPPLEMLRALSELERFIHVEDSLSPIIKAGLVHAQFETIHPFLDGNGRTGRMLVTLFLRHIELLTEPVLFLSHYFRQHQQEYYRRLYDYHRGEVKQWVDFFLDGVLVIAEEAISIAERATQVWLEDQKRVSSLSRVSAKSAAVVLQELFRYPIVNVTLVQKWTGFTRPGAQKVINRLVDLKILKHMDKGQNYNRLFVYRRYLDIFSD